MEQKDISEVADKIFALRPDEAYAKDEVIARMRGYNAAVYDCKRGEVCVKAGTRADRMMLVLSGIVHLWLKSEIGDDILMGIAHPGDYVGLSLIYDPIKTHPITATAYTDAEVVYYDVDLVRAFRSDPRSLPLFNFIGRKLCKTIKTLGTRTTVLSGATIAERLRRYLAIRMQHEKSHTFVMPGTERDFAKYLGVNTCALSRVLGKLAAEGKITYRKNVITVLNLD